MSDKKLSLKEAMKAEEVKRHNSAISNAVCVIVAIDDKRRELKKALAQCDEDEKYVRDLAAKTEDDPISVNDDRGLHSLYTHYGSYRGGRGFCRAGDAITGRGDSRPVFL